MSRQDKEGQQQAAQTLDTELRWLEGHFDSLGPYFMGTEFSLVDTSLLPFFLRASVLQHYRGYNLPSVRAAAPFTAIKSNLGLFGYVCSHTNKASSRAG